MFKQLNLDIGMTNRRAMIKRMKICNDKHEVTAECK